MSDAVTEMIGKKYGGSKELDEDRFDIGVPAPLRGGRIAFPTPRFIEKKYSDRYDPVPKRKSKCMTCRNRFEIEESAFIQVACREGLLNPFDKQDSWQTMTCKNYEESTESKERKAALKKKRIMQDAGVTISLEGEEDEETEG